MNMFPIGSEFETQARKNLTDRKRKISMSAEQRPGLVKTKCRTQAPNPHNVLGVFIVGAL